MKIDNLRASTINTYKDCAFKFFLQYVCGLACSSSKKAHLGTIVHHVLEIVAKANKSGHWRLQDKYCNTEYLLKICWERYTKKIYPAYEWLPLDYKFCQKMIDIVMNSNLNPAKFDIFATEHQFEIELNLPGMKYDYGNNNSGCLKLRGTIDLITQKDGDFWIYDWKTGERKDWISGEPKELDGFQMDLQLRIYDLALSILYPHVEHRMFTVVFIRDGGPFTVSFDSKDRENTISEIRRIFNKIKADDSPKRLKDDPSRKSQAWKCKYVCDFGKTKDEKGVSLCDKYFKLLTDEGIERASEKLYNLTVSAEASRRNDYARQNIKKATLHDSL